MVVDELKQRKSERWHEKTVMSGEAGKGKQRRRHENIQEEGKREGRQAGRKEGRRKGWEGH